LSALLAAYSPRLAGSSAFDPKVPKILIVSQPHTPGQQPLPCTTDEAAAIHEQFKNTSVLLTHLNGTLATVDAVLEEMTKHECQWLHLACHGAQDSTSPTGSAFYLHDGQLSLSRLMRISHLTGELAVLSACQTAKGDEQLPEEAVHLAAGMLATGYKSVVATMWSIADVDGPVLADALYASLKHNMEAGTGLAAAYALHDAVAKLRGVIGEKNFVRWVPFVHFGI
jgi:CHAT domain-containing protein